MTSLKFFFIVIPILAGVLLLLNFILSPHNPDSEKLLIYECGFSGVSDQTRDTFNILFISVCLAFLILDLELILIYPLTSALGLVGVFGLVIAMIFFILLTLGYILEIISDNLNVTASSSAPSRHGA
jgi:NADH:ubiquinone oxidoreductase subunit 3 (subunit A)